MLRIHLVAMLAVSLFVVGCAPANQNKGGDAADAKASNSNGEEANHDHGHDHAHDSDMQHVQRAVCVLRSVGDSGVTGTLTFTAEGGKVKLQGTVSGLTPGKHGFHVHEFGDVSNLADGTSAGGHYNPAGEKHGAPDAEHRHVGDLGNIEAGDDGVANVDISDAMIALEGAHSIVGRSIVVHAGADKFTGASGDAGPRVAVGVIGIAKGAE